MTSFLELYPAAKTWLNEQREYKTKAEPSSNASWIKVLLVLGWLLAGTSLAQLTQVGNALFKLPDGWRQIKQGQLTALVPPDLSPDQKLAIILAPPQPLGGDFKQAFENALKGALADNEELVEAGELQPQRSKNGFDVLGKVLHIQEKGGANPTVRLYLGAKVGGRLEIAVIIANDQILFDQYQEALQTFTQSWNFTDLAKASTTVSPAAKATPLEAIYVADIGQMRPKSFGIGYDFVSFNVFWLILPGGRIYFGFPPGDPSFFNFDRAKTEQPDKMGSYKVAGNQIQFSYRNTQVSFAKGADTVPLGKLWSGQNNNTVFRRIDPCNNCHLNGVFARQSFTDLSSGLNSAGVSGEVRFSFGLDGRFALEGFSGFTADGGLVGVGGSEKNTARGSYSIKNNMLELTYDDGRHQRTFFFRYPGEEDRVISINGANYLRRNP